MINYELQVAFKLQVNQLNLQFDIPVIQVGGKMIWVDSLMLRVTKKIQFDENVTSLTEILRVDKNITGW